MRILNFLLRRIYGSFTTRAALGLIRIAGVALGFGIIEVALNVLLVLNGHPPLDLVPTALVASLIGFALVVGFSPAFFKAWARRRSRLQRSAILFRRLYDRMEHVHGVELCGGLAGAPRTTGTFGRVDPNYETWAAMADRARRAGLCGPEFHDLVLSARWAASAFGRNAGEMHDEDIALAEYVSAEARRLARWDSRLPNLAA
jgi:hypothetical protein